MEMIELQGVDNKGTLRVNPQHIVCYDEQQLILLGQVIDLIPGTAKAMDKILKERCGVAYLRVEPVEELANG